MLFRSCKVLKNRKGNSHIYKIDVKEVISSLSSEEFRLHIPSKIYEYPSYVAMLIIEAAILIYIKGLLTYKLT